MAVFDTETKIPPEKISFALNQRLPEDIRIQKSEEVNANFHPRYCDSIKTYEYRILNRKFPDPLNRLYTHFVYMPLDVDKMKAAAAYLVGEHDFKSFCSAKTQVTDTVRTVYDLTVERDDEDVITLRITGSGFLYTMVRIIAGTLLWAGTGLIEPERVQQILEAKDRREAGPTAPAKGLTLIRMHYPDEV